jgi:hypothetical protein
MTGGEEIKGKKMPIMKKPLTEEELSTVRTWVEGLTRPAPLSAPIMNITPSSE